MVKERIAAALRSGDNRKLDDALHTWLEGISTDTELSDELQIRNEDGANLPDYARAEGAIFTTRREIRRRGVG